MIRIVPILSLLVLALNGNAASFQNLGFDDANTNNLTTIFTPDPMAPAEEMLPGWQLHNGTFSFNSIGLNLHPSGLGGISSIYNSQQTFFPWSGTYSLGLWPGYDLMTQLYRPHSLVQIGDVPAEANSIRFFNYGSPFELRVNNNVVPLSYEYFTFLPNPTIRVANVSGDISPYAGMNVELRFATIDSPLETFNGIDSITFSTQPVPEPGAFGLLLVGMVALLIRRRRPQPS